MNYSICLPITIKYNYPRFLKIDDIGKLYSVEFITFAIKSFPNKLVLTIQFVWCWNLIKLIYPTFIRFINLFFSYN